MVPAATIACMLVLLKDSRDSALGNLNTWIVSPQKVLSMGLRLIPKALALSVYLAVGPLDSKLENFCQSLLRAELCPPKIHMFKSQSPLQKATVFGNTAYKMWLS